MYVLTNGIVTSETRVIFQEKTIAIKTPIRRVDIPCRIVPILIPVAYKIIKY